MSTEPPGDNGSIASLIFARLASLAADWEKVEPVAGVAEQPIFAITEGLLSLIVSQAETPDLSRLRAAAAEADPRALTMLLRLRGYAPQALQEWYQTVDALMRAHNYVELVKSSGPLADLAEASADLDSILRCRIYQARASYELGLEREAEAAYRRAIDVAAILPSPDPKQLAICHVNLGVLLSRGARLDEAIEHYDRALELDPTMPTIISTREDKAEAMRMLGRFGAAANLHLSNLHDLEEAGIRGYRLAVVLDNLATVRMATGESDEALTLLKRAAGEFAADDLESRAVNMWRQADAARALNRRGDAAKAFTVARDLLSQTAKAGQSEGHFRGGFEQARAHRLPDSSPVRIGLALGHEASLRGEWDTAQKIFAVIADQARAAGDGELALRCQAHVAAVLADARMIDAALALCTQVQDDAVRLGYALPAMMVCGTKASLVDSGSDTGAELGALGLWFRCQALADVYQANCAAAGIAPDDLTASVRDLGHIDRGLARLAADYYANDLAVSYFQTSIDKAVAFMSGQVEGLTGLLELTTREQMEQAAGIVAAPLDKLLARPGLSALSRLAGHRAMAAYLFHLDVQAGIRHLRLAAAELEKLRRALPPGSIRANLDAAYPVYRLLTRLQTAVGDDVGAFEALQCERARRLAESLSAAAGDQEPYQPPTVDEARQLVARVGAKAALVDIMLNPGGVRVHLLTADGLQSFDVTQPPLALSTARRAMFGDVRQRAVDAIRVVSESPLFAEIAENVIARLDPGASVLLTVDDALANLPLHVAPVHGRPWCEVMPICRLPAVGVLRFTPPSRVWSGRSLVAGDSRNDLPGAAAECRQAAGRLGGDALIGDSCTLAAVRETLTGADLDIVHLAVHGRGDVRRGGRASLLFADGAGSMEWVPFDELAQLPFHCDLIVLSGCSTAVGGPRNGSGLYGVAEAAAEAGAISVIASLWPVGDQHAATFMETFYTELARLRADRDRVIDLRSLVDHARSALRAHLETPTTRRDGRELEYDGDAPKSDEKYSAMLDWAAFVVLGDPMLRFSEGS